MVKLAASTVKDKITKTIETQITMAINQEDTYKENSRNLLASTQILVLLEMFSTHTNSCTWQCFLPGHWDHKEVNHESLFNIHYKVYSTKKNFSWIHACICCDTELWGNRNARVLILKIPTTKIKTPPDPTPTQPTYTEKYVDI